LRPITTGNRKINFIAFSVFIDSARLGIFLACAPQQNFTQELGVSLAYVQRRKEYPCLVPATRVMRIEAIVAKFGNLNDCVGSARQMHPRLNSADRG